MKHVLPLLVLGMLLWAAAALAGPVPVLLPLFGPQAGELEQLDLTGEQKSRIEQIVQAGRESSKPLLQQLRQIAKDTHQQVNAVLTAEQRTRLESQRSDLLVEAP
ncbi:hypothetical protein [Gloeobacter morelensis]|uniref:Uncharacterized protein n=1 Tax=Gloeobacter morelensis MG652769 TaxID=2781736 RepID=A0ABY3PRA4_9CYAN|nr:hypothetical protein [Gloeobacter morelensis]UFP96218.1 hypothetical protein ISF26_08435 [Gloeobacter morelensis MG652769]